MGNLMSSSPGEGLSLSVMHFFPFFSIFFFMFIIVYHPLIFRAHSSCPQTFCMGIWGEIYCREAQAPDSKSSHLQWSFTAVTAESENKDANGSEGKVHRAIPGPFHHPPLTSDVFK